jgi:hypothetical protein
MEDAKVYDADRAGVDARLAYALGGIPNNQRFCNYLW